MDGNNYDIAAKLAWWNYTASSANFANLGLKRRDYLKEFLYGSITAFALFVIILIFSTGLIVGLLLSIIFFIISVLIFVLLWDLNGNAHAQRCEAKVL